jgi:arylsulfatase A-like enzyme
MRIILLFFDTLNRRFLPPYGCDWIKAPNFKRLAEKTVVFDNHYAGSLYCIPARRELHTGRYNFLHRSWGPLEPFDDSMPRILKKNGIYTHLVSDHYHYWEVGGSTYHNQYNTWEIIRGHEGDPWKGEVKNPEIPNHVFQMREGFMPHWRQDWINRKYMQSEERMPQTRTIKKGIDFIRANYKENNWFLHIETFDPHEPFFTPERFKNFYKHEYDGPHFDWPNYNIVTETPDQINHCRMEYAASISMCDYNLGLVLDLMDEYDMWKDTMLIVTTDHGFLLSEKGWWGKALMPIYNEIAHIPLFIWDPRLRKKKERRTSLVQTIDLAPTILEFFGIKVPKDMQGKALKNTIEDDFRVREYALFGSHGTQVNVTDGQYVYMRGPGNKLNKPLNEYTLIPTHMRDFFSMNELKTAELVEPFSFTKGVKLIRYNTSVGLGNPFIYGTKLFDLKSDPEQNNPLIDNELERQFIKILVELMKQNDAPIEQYSRLEIPIDDEVEDYHLRLNEIRDGIQETFGQREIIWRKKGMSLFYLLLGFLHDPMQNSMKKQLEQVIIKSDLKEITEDLVLEMFHKFIPESFKTYITLMTEIVRKKAK